MGKCHRRQPCISNEARIFYAAESRRLSIGAAWRKASAKMSKSIEVCKQSVIELLKTGCKNVFVIPEYQRPYAWTEDEVITLFSDIMNFVKNDGGKGDKNKTYFLGSIVSYVNDDQQQEVIDGQQRLTSIFLLLRAIFYRLEKGSLCPQSDNFIRQIGPIIWFADPLTNKVNKTRPLILSKAVGDHDGDVFMKILETGVADGDAKDNYSRNYRKFQDLYMNASREDPLIIYDFIYAVLNQAILLPISAGDQDAALTIFSTLNDRGLPLTDADIFKAKIYGRIKSCNGEYQEFIRAWQELQERCERTQESMQSLFYYYMFYLRAKEKDSVTTTPGLRKYFLADKCRRLFDESLMDNLVKIVNLWEFVKLGQGIETEPWMSSSEIRNALDILNSYPNEFWKYPVVIYYIVHHGNEDFQKTFVLFLRKLGAVLLCNYLVKPSVSAVKSQILKLDVEIMSSNVPRFVFDRVDSDELKKRIMTPHGRMVRMILKMLAYEKQKESLPVFWEIEHILPRKWKPMYFPNLKEEYVNEWIEHIGNKVPFEKVLNIVASNGYFEKKCSEYAKSKIQITKDLAACNLSDWTIEQIKERDIKVSKELEESLAKIETDYHIEVNDGSNTPTEEEMRLIESFKRKGFI